MTRHLLDLFIELIVTENSLNRSTKLKIKFNINLKIKNTNKDYRDHKNFNKQKFEKSLLIDKNLRLKIF